MNIDEELKVFKNHLQGGYCNGVLLVAAHSIAEAHATAMNCEGLDGTYWEYNWLLPECPKVPAESYSIYPHDGWTEVEGLVYRGYPRVIVENHYIE